jgi:hypothetical protein
MRRLLFLSFSLFFFLPPLLRNRPACAVTSLPYPDVAL